MNENGYDLLIDESDGPILHEEECKDVKQIVADFVKVYTDNKDKPVETWLAPKMQELLPERKPEEIDVTVKEIIESIEVAEKKKNSLSKAINNGRSKESWFASEVKTATSAMSAQESAKYLAGLDQALENANESLYRTITTQAGKVSMNPNLDGFIAEQYHAQTFNLNAEARGSQYRAKVLEPQGSGYAKNSVDIVIVDKNGKVVRRYQSKYCKDSQATQDAFEKGDYRGQQKLVSEGQDAEISKKTTTVLEAPDGTTSNSLTKSRAEQMRDEAQSGNWNDLNWKEYAMKDLALGIGKQAGYAALQGAAIGTGFDVAQKLWKGEEVNTNEVVENALKSGADFGLKAAVGGALKVGVEKDIITVIPKGTPAGTIANIAFVAVENVKVIGKVAAGEYTLREGIDKIEQTTVATTAGLMTMGKGAALGASLGLVFGPVGVAVGGFIGGSLGYIAGSKVGETFVKCRQKIRNKVHEVARNLGAKVVNVAKKVGSSFRSFCSSVAGFFGF